MNKNTNNENIWFSALWAVVKEDGTFAGVPCASYEEAADLASQYDNSTIYSMEQDIS